MTKREVLEQVYPDELPIIFDKYKNEEKEQAITRVTGYINSYMAGVASRFEPQAIQDYLDGLLATLDKIKGLDGLPEPGPDKELTVEEINAGIDRYKRGPRFQNAENGYGRFN